MRDDLNYMGLITFLFELYKHIIIRREHYEEFTITINAYVHK
jgi:hypothetical protein